MARRTKQQWQRWVAARMSRRRAEGREGYINIWCHPYNKRSKQHLRQMQRWLDFMNGWKFYAAADRRRRKITRRIAL